MSSTGTTALDASHGPPRIRGGPILPWLVVVVGVAASVFLFTALRDAVENVARLRFERQASDVKAVIEGRIDSYTNVLFGLRALFATGEVSRIQFHHFLDALNLPQRYPGFEVVNFAAYVPGDAIEPFVDAVRRDTSISPEGYPAFAIRPPGQRSEYFVLVYLEPFAGNEFAFGLDLGANPAVSGTDAAGLAALQHAARDSGALVASGRLIRIKARKEYVGLAIRLAVYRSGVPIATPAERRTAYIGSVGAGFNVDKLMRTALDSETSRALRLRLYDAGSVAERTPSARTPERLLFDSTGGAATAAAGHEDIQTLFTHVLPIEVGGRFWEMHFTARKDQAIGPVDALLPWVVLLSGVISSLLLYGVLASLASSRTRAVHIADEITQDLRKREASLRESQALLSDAQKLSHVGYCQYRPHDGSMIWSEELYRMHGLDAQTFAPNFESAIAHVHPDDRDRWRSVIAETLHDGTSFASEFRIVRADGSVRHLRSLGEVMSEPAGDPPRMLWSVLDITEQKQTEDALRHSAEQLTALSRRLVEVQEAEKRKLARELHDRVGQNLTALSINLDILRTTLAGDAYARHCARLRDCSLLLESTVDSIENVMSELRPPMLDDYGLLPALQWYAKAFSERTGIAVEVLGSDSSLERPAANEEIALFRIAQEALNNVAKHAHARSVRIDLEHANSHCVLTVTDDGVGMGGARSQAKDRRRQGLGMVTMRERAEAVGGRFRVMCPSSGGTQVAVEIP